MNEAQTRLNKIDPKLRDAAHSLSPCDLGIKPKHALSTTIGDTCWQRYEKVEIIQNKMRTNVDFYFWAC